MGNIKVIEKNTKKIIKNGFFRAKFLYTKYYEKLEIEKDTVLIQSYDGSSISSNEYYILLELNSNQEYSKLKKYIVVRKNNREQIIQFLNSRDIKNYEVVTIHSKEYCRILAQAEYLINNSTFPQYFIKKEGQKYLNTWHGTPLKAMGRNIISAPNELGNTQRNFMMADYMLEPNEFSFEHFKEDYMLDNLYKGKYLLAGYPRNSAFYNEKLKKEIKEKYGLNDKKIVVYMPTWRGTLKDKKNNIQYYYTMHLLYELEQKLTDDYVVYVKLHNYTNSLINYKAFKKILPFPINEYETYEFLNVADCLITDYSSVLFDFANTSKKIILYAYDKNEYLKDRGMYLDFDNLPFSLATNTDKVIEELVNLDNYSDYSEFKNEYCKYDSKDSAKILCDYVFKNKRHKLLKVYNGEDYCNNKENVLIFAGALQKNGITTALKGIVNNIDIEERNYIITFYKSSVEKNKKTINDFKNLIYIPIQGQKNFTLKEAFYNFLYYRLKINTRYLVSKMDKIYKREIKRVFPNLKFEYVIHYTGYEKNIMNLFKNIDAKKMIYVHNDLMKEEKTKGNFDKNSLLEAYRNYDNIVLVRETMKNEIKAYLKPGNENKIRVAHNLNNIELIKENAKQSICFDEDTYCNVDETTLKEILDRKDIKKYINISRFSPEKGQDMLIEAFENYQKSSGNENDYLILIGGYGKSFKEINEMALKNKNIIIIKSISNPYPILNKCDCFVLSSRYEGLPMVIMEALILNKVVISTDITGPREFLNQGYGYLVEESVSGIEKGMKNYKSNKIPKMEKFDAEEFNRKALKEFYDLFD